MVRKAPFVLRILICTLAALPPSGHADMEAPTLKDLVASLSQVVRGRVRLAETALETFPLNDHGDVARVVVTYFEVEASEHLIGKTGPKIALRLLGGRLGDSAVVHTEAPAMRSGEDVVLFLAPSTQPRGSTGEQAYILPHAHYGKFELAAVDGVVTATRSVSNRSLGRLDGVDAGSNSVPLGRLRELVVAQAEALGKGE